MDILRQSGAAILLGMTASAAVAGSESIGAAQDSEANVSVASEKPGESQVAARASDHTGSRLLEEVVVTAQKREENLQEVPISVSAFTADQLDARGIEEPKALATATPGMSYQTTASYAIIFIRGVGSDAFIPSADPSVATYIDGIYYPMNFGLAAALGKLQRIEVLKGPQGTLFGRNTTGGAINIITKQPDKDFNTEIVASRESYDKTNVRVYTSIPLSDDLAVSLSGLDYTEEAYYRLSADNPRNEMPRETSRAFQAKTRWTPGDFDITLGTSQVQTKGSMGTLSPIQFVRPLGTALGVHSEPDYQYGGDTPNYIDTTTTVLTFDAKYSAPWLDLRLIGGKQKVKALGLIDYDGSTQPLLTFEGAGQYADVKTAELQLLSNDGTWGSDWLKSIAGVYYLNSSAGYDPLFFSVAPQVLQYLANPPSTGPLSILRGLTAPLISGLNGISGATGLPISNFLNGGINLNLQGVLETNSLAYFVQSAAQITDTLSLTLGGRYQDETRKLAKSTTRVALNPNDRDQVVPIFNFGTREQSFTNFSPKVSLDWKFTDHNMVYGSWSKGFKSGTFNIIAIYEPTQYIKPEITTTTELGYKGSLLDGNMQLNAAVFQNKITNLQVQTISLTSGGAVAFETAGSARIQGAEFDLLWVPLPELASGLVFTATGSYLDGKYTDYKDGSGFDEQSGLFFKGTGGVIGGGILPGRDFTGHQTIRTPKFSGTSGLSYTLDLGNGEVEVAGDVYYNSGFYSAAQNNPSSHQDAYHVFNARTSYFYKPWDLRVTLFGKNLDGAKYYYSIQEVDFGTWKALAAPAIYGLRMQWNF